MAYLLVLIGALLRVLPHPANFAPIGAVALFGGVYLPKKFALALPIAAMVVSDFFIGCSLVGSVIFYLITNFAFFYSTSMYSHDLAGVMASYINAIPFFRNTILGDLFYTTIFFGSYELVRFYVKNYKGSRSKSRA